MKNTAKLICLVFTLLMLSSGIDAQPKLWGTIPRGGGTESGEVYEINLDGSDFNVTKEFIFPNCNSPRGKLLYASNGMIYGTAEGGLGSSGSVIYEYDPLTSTFDFAYDFFDQETAMSANTRFTSLIEHSNGKVYGFTQNRGDNYDGQLFEFDMQTRELNIKVHFEEATKGETPMGSLTEASDGRLYGVTMEGGTHDLGVLYVYDPATNIFAALKHFDGAGIGSYPNDGPIQASNGKLYGMTRTGGTSGMGVVYEYDIATNIITKKHDFDGLNTGAGPESKFMQASNGKLYAVTRTGGTVDQGTIFEYDIATSVLTKKQDIGGSNGTDFVCQLIEYTDGLLYGMASSGGLEDKGVLFKFDPESSSYTKLQDFYDEYGERPLGSLSLGPDGKLIGVTMDGGQGTNSGVLFDYNPSNGLFSAHVNFGYSENGGLPECSLIEASDGMIYGTASSGGANYSGGTIFRINPSDRSFEKVYDFWSSIDQGGGCNDGLTEGTNGMLYGLGSQGGVNNSGVLFVFDPINFTYTVLHHFDENTSGSRPVGKLIQDTNGNLYGVTKWGGANGDGVLFEYNTSTSTFLKLHDFDATISGREPTGVTQATNGKLYGMTTWGGAYNLGVLFEYDLMTFAMASKVNFDDLNKGALPFGILLEYEDNQLYGMTAHGGSQGGGVLFHYDATSGIFTKLKNFLYDDGDGFSPFSSLMKASNNLIYGTTSMGGSQEYGVIFSYDPSAVSYTVVHEFAHFQDRPIYGKLLEVDTDFGISEQADNKLKFTIYPNPAEEHIILSISEIKGELQLSIYDISGKLILTDYIGGKGSSNSDIKYDIPNLESGIYTIRLNSADRSGSQKLIVN